MEGYNKTCVRSERKLGGLGACSQEKCFETMPSIMSENALLQNRI